MALFVLFLVTFCFASSYYLLVKHRRTVIGLDEEKVSSYAFVAFQFVLILFAACFLYDKAPLSSVVLGSVVLSTGLLNVKLFYDYRKREKAVLRASYSSGKGKVYEGEII